MNASTSAPGSSGACRASSARNSRPAFSSWLHVAPGIGAQVRAQRGRGADPAEQRCHRAVPQQVHVIDAVRARGHPGDQARDLQVRVDAALAARRDVLRDQVRQARRAAPAPSPGPGPACDTRFGSSNDACVFARLCNNRTCRCPLEPGAGSVRNSHRPSSEGTFRVDTPENTPN